AIPIRIVKAILRRVSMGDEYRPTWLGVRIVDVTKEIADALGLDTPRGVIIEALAQDGPLRISGMQTGDVILEINGYQIQNAPDLRYATIDLQAGDVVAIDFVRNGQAQKARAQLSLAPQTPAPDLYKGEERTPLFGATMANISPALALESGLDSLRVGVVILELTPGLTAARLGFKIGDIIREVNGRSIDDTEELRKRLPIKLGGWDIAIEREGRRLQLQVR
ncbi:MAG: PDZ domain-containing protein, partial [Pseudomonadota bacterium]